MGVAGRAESSIAAPFTSSTQSIRAMVDVIREGRAALVSSVASFKFMAMYSLTQLISVLRLYEVNATLTDGMFLWIDLFLVLPFVVTMSQTGAAKGLARLRPQGRLVSPAVLASIIGQVLLVIVFQVLVARAVHQMPLFECDALCPTVGSNASSTSDFNSTHPLLSQAANGSDPGRSAVVSQERLNEIEVHGDGELCWAGVGAMEACCRSQPLGCPTHAIHSNPKVNSVSVEATAAFLLSQYQYLAALIAFSSGAPYRLPAYSNYWLVFNLSVAVVVCLVLTFAVEGGGFLDLIVGMIRLVPFPDAAFPGAPPRSRDPPKCTCFRERHMNPSASPASPATKFSRSAKHTLKHLTPTACPDGRHVAMNMRAGRLLVISIAGIGSACALESAIANADDLLALGLSELGESCTRSAGSGAGARADFRNFGLGLEVVLANCTHARFLGRAARVVVAGAILAACVVVALVTVL